MPEVLITPQTSSRPNSNVTEGDHEATLLAGSSSGIPPSVEEWLLADVDDLARFRAADGLSYEQHAQASVKQNKLTAIKEGAMPDAVSEVEHEWLPNAESDHGGIIRDLGRTAVQTAMRGRDLYYRFSESRARGDIEVDYAAYNQAEMRLGTAHVIIQPKMSSADGPLEVAKAEGLAETDSIQVNWLGLGEDGKAVVAKTTSILVADIPLEAWVKMLADDSNIFGKAILVDNPESALSVMEIFSELDLPLEKLPEGPLTILATVIPYIQDTNAKEKVTNHLQKLRGDQQEMHRLAISPADRWLQFDMATEQSLHHGLATKEVQLFIESLESNWGDKDRAVIEGHKVLVESGAAYRMTRELAKVLQKAARNLFLTSAAVVVGNQKVIDQMSSVVAERIYQGEIALSQPDSVTRHMGHLVTAHNNVIAGLNIKVGAGCCPILEPEFLSDTVGDTDEAALAKRRELSWHGGSIKDGTCVNCTQHTKVGVKSWCKPCIENTTRKKAA